MNHIMKKDLPFKEIEINDLEIKLLHLKDLVVESKELIELGFKYLLKVNFRNKDEWAYPIFLLFLSRGFELLMKAMICYKTYESNHDSKNEETYFPSTAFLKENLGHNLVKLKGLIIQNYKGIKKKENKGNERLIKELREDCYFLSNDKNLLSLLEIFSDYARQGRYYELNMITESNKSVYSAKIKFDNIILSFIQKDKALSNEWNKEENNSSEDDFLNDIDGVWSKVVKENIFPILKNYFETLYRQFSYGLLGEKAVEVSCFLEIISEINREGVPGQ
ncbi:hypothetical protein KJ830_10890 [bacterium]|nr:hypothetical protein [bacterium]MBU4511535.1 hypothetical protein [bacterium]